MLLGKDFYYETDFGIFSTYGAENSKIGFLKAYASWAFKKPIFIIRINSFIA